MIQRTEVDGVPTVIAPRPGPLSAGLVFRVGRADETLARSGITHLVEHLALHRQGLTDYHFSGSTGLLHTHFHLQGSEADIVTYLSGVCESLLDLPMERLETEKAILRTEEAGRGRGANDELPLWRYGAQGYGLVSYPEWGLSQLRAEDVWHWAQMWFTRENAALWIAGDHVPRGLRLRLRNGARRPVPRPSSALPATPAYYASDNGVVVLDAVVRRSTAAVVAAKVLERELFRTLRQQGGYSYTAATAYDPRGDGFATITALADALPDKRDAVLGGFIDVLAKLRVGRIDQADVDAVRAQAWESAAAPDADAAKLPSHAADLLTGRPIKTAEELRDDLRAVTREHVHAVLTEVMGSALLQVPQGRSADWAGLSEAPVHSPGTVTGTRYPSRESGDVGLVIGSDGAGLMTPSGPVTVRFDECVAALAWPDGARRLIGADGMVVHIEPTLYALKGSALATIDARVHPSTVVSMPARRPDAVPQPRARSSSRAPATRGRFETATLVVCTVLTILWTGIALITTATIAGDKTLRGAVGWFMIGVAWLIEYFLASPIIKIIRRRRSARR
jgi:zinc protease